MTFVLLYRDVLLRLQHQGLAGVGLLLLKKYKRALVLVPLSSLLAQLFGLAIPLLLQQIIDKVLSRAT